MKISTYHLYLLSRHGATHVCGPGGGEESGVAEFLDALLPGLGRFFGRVDVLEALAICELDRVLDPAALNFDRGRSVGEERGAVRSVQVESAGMLVVYCWFK
jgi:hypothetical protein